MIQYINNLPNKVDYYDLIRNVYDDIDVSQLSQELESSIACVCVYNGERLVGMGRVKKENDYLCIEDLIVKLEDCKEEIQNNIIVNLFTQLNQMKNYDIIVRDGLNMRASNEELLFKRNNESNVQEAPTMYGIENQSQTNGYAHA